VALSPNSVSPECPTLFGWATDGSAPPPYGSGTLQLYDGSNISYVATYTPTSVVVTAGECTVNFHGPELNLKSAGGLRKIVRVEGDCLAPENPCGQSYWVANASRYLIFMDAAPAGTCPALFGFISEHSDYQAGMFNLVAIASERMFMELPPMFSGDYTNTGVFTRVGIRADGCMQSYETDRETLALVPISADSGAIPPGSVSVTFHKVVPRSCPTACFKSGYNAFWDASGAHTPPFAPTRIDPVASPTAPPHSARVGMLPTAPSASRARAHRNLHFPALCTGVGRKRR
jgi:hypothetical protein